MKFNELREELLDRGFDYLTEARASRFLNDAYVMDLCEGEDWPFLEATKSGAAPLEIADLRTIEYVVNTTTRKKLTPIVRGRLTDEQSVDLTETGTPEFYYVVGGNKVNVFPARADTIAVRYWKFAAPLTGEEEPLLPKRFHSLIVDGAMYRAYQEKDNYELTREARVLFEAGRQTMEDSLLNQQRDAPDDFVVLEDPAALR